MTTCVGAEIDVTGAGFAAAVASVRSGASGLAAHIGLLPPAAAKAVLGSLTALREDIARVEVAVVAHFAKLGAPKHAGARSTEAWLEQHAHKSGWAAKQVTAAITASESPVVRAALERGGSSASNRPRCSRRSPRGCSRAGATTPSWPRSCRRPPGRRCGTRSSRSRRCSRASTGTKGGRRRRTGR